MDRALTLTIVVSTVPKKDLVIVLPYLGKLLLKIRTGIDPVIGNKLLHCKWWISFKTKYKLFKFFAFKDKITLFWRSGIVYKFNCGGCNVTYYGKTKRHFKVGMSEHLGISTLTGKRVKGDNHLPWKNIIYFAIIHLVFDNFSILASSNNDFNVTLMESILIISDPPSIE